MPNDTRVADMMRAVMEIPEFMTPDPIIVSERVRQRLMEIERQAEQQRRLQNHMRDYVRGQVDRDVMRRERSYRDTILSQYPAMSPLLAQLAGMQRNVDTTPTRRLKSNDTDLPEVLPTNSRCFEEW